MRAEADYHGLLLMAQAGYDPNEALHVVERQEALAKRKAEQSDSISSDDSARKQQLESWLEEALKLYDPSTGITVRDLPQPSGL